MVSEFIHWLSGETKEDRVAAAKSKQRFDEASKKHTAACERHAQVSAETSKSAKELQEVTAEARQCFAEYVASETTVGLKAVKESGGENLP